VIHWFDLVKRFTEAKSYNLSHFVKTARFDRVRAEAAG
jgi:hypothetical protein